MRQRRRAERGQLTARSGKQLTAVRRMDEQRVQRMLVIGAAAVLAVIVGVVSYVMFQDTYQSPRQVIAEIGGNKIEARDVLPQARLDALASGQVNITGSVNDYARDMIFRERGATVGASVSPEDIDDAVIGRFERRDKQGELPEVLTDSGRDAMRSYIERANVSEEDYRDWVEGQLIQAEIARAIEDQVPESMEQMFIHWIVTQSVVETEAALARIDGGESFGDVAAEVNRERLFSDERGSVGWVPEDAFAELDAILFNDAIVLNETMGPLTTSLGSMLLKVTGGPVEQRVSEANRILVGQNRFQAWMDKQTAELVSTLSVSSEDAQWILDHL